MLEKEVSIEVQGIITEEEVLEVEVVTEVQETITEEDLVVEIEEEILEDLEIIIEEEQVVDIEEVSVEDQENCLKQQIENAAEAWFRRPAPEFAKGWATGEALRSLRRKRGEIGGGYS